MDKNYNHKDHEEKIYSLWEKGGFFQPQKDSQKKPFTIIMPPPNANDPLHIGHARFVTIEDTLIRYHRMKGEATLWLPGADHAGIETQFVFEKKLKEQGKSRFDFDRDTLYKMIWDYVQENKSTMENQLRQLGASCDWTREKFTLDPDIIKIVYQTFKKLSDDGLVYRAKRLVNYCTHCGTGYSNLEVDHIERTDPLYYMKYGPFTLATVRPETKFGDTAVAVNPKDTRYKKYVGQEVEVEGLIGKFIVKVIADDAVDPEFGTGVVKVTPAHDFNDFEMGQRHNLEVKQVIDLDGKLNNLAGKYSGLYIKEARKKIAEDLEKAGLLVKVDEKYKHTIGVCYRCKNTIEPMLMEQWFIKVEPLTKKSLEAIKTGKVKFAAKKYEKIAVHWLKNLRDWNISRQIVWGIRIPAWQCDKCKEWTITNGTTPSACSCGGTQLTQEVDTFDTWFSSGQWPFAALLAQSEISNRDKYSDFSRFYPTQVMNTGYDILPFWVLRMIMLGIYTTNDVPFENVVCHGLVRDAQGQKISKSKGNVINPLEMAEKYGTDALRMGILWGALVENDVALSENNIRAQRNFTNKLWNIARFALDETKLKNRETEKLKNRDDEWVLEELKSAQKKITQSLENYRLNEGAELLYDFVWKKLADVYIEKIKNRREEAQPTLLYILQETLKLAHPFMPFITEAIWQIARAQYTEHRTKELFQNESLIIAVWPRV